MLFLLQSDGSRLTAHTEHHNDGHPRHHRADHWQQRGSILSRGQTIVVVGVSHDNILVVVVATGADPAVLSGVQDVWSDVRHLR